MSIHEAPAGAKAIEMTFDEYNSLKRALENIEQHPDTTEDIAQIVREALHTLRAKVSTP